MTLGDGPTRAGAARVWVATVARTLKLSGVFVLPQPQDLSEDISEKGSVDSVGMAAHG